MASVRSVTSRNTSNQSAQERPQADAFINRLAFLPDGAESTDQAITLDIGKYILPLISDNDDLSKFIVDQAEANNGSCEIVLTATVNLNSRVRNDGTRDAAIAALMAK